MPLLAAPVRKVNPRNSIYCDGSHDERLHDIIELNFKWERLPAGSLLLFIGKGGDGDGQRIEVVAYLADGLGHRNLRDVPGL